MDWIKLSDKLPQHGDKILLWLVPKNDKPYYLGWTWEEQDGPNIRINGDKITHWIKFEPPKP